jgi:hypothetical protein
MNTPETPKRRGPPLAWHIKLLVQAVLAWGVFWLLGWPDYYRQYSANAVGIGCVLLSVLISLLAIAVLLPARPSQRLQRANWIAFYFSVPFLLLDYLYCGLYKGHGLGFLWTYWYLSAFYVSVWLTFPPTAWLLNRVPQAPAKAKA